MEFLIGITRLEIVLYPSSWGRFQVNAYSFVEGEEKCTNQSWGGNPSKDVDFADIEWAIKEINKQREKIDA